VLPATKQTRPALRSACRQYLPERFCIPRSRRGIGARRDGASPAVPPYLAARRRVSDAACAALTRPHLAVAPHGAALSASAFAYRCRPDPETPGSSTPPSYNGKDPTRSTGKSLSPIEWKHIAQLGVEAW